jgi:hypothetical protein
MEEQIYCLRLADFFLIVDENTLGFENNTV